MSAERRHETIIQGREPRQENIWNNSFDSGVETAGCCGKNIEEVLFLRNIFSGTETINNKENENKVSFQLKSEFSLNDVERTRSFVEERCTLSFCYGSKL